MKKKLNCILLIDDDTATNFIHKKIIEKSEIVNHIEVTLNGSEALDYLINKGNQINGDGLPLKPDLILLDINMPVMDGWEFIRAYQNLNQSVKEGTVVVMLTSSSNPDDRIRAGEIAEVYGFKNKLLTPNLFSEIMNECFK